MDAAGQAVVPLLRYSNQSGMVDTQNGVTKSRHGVATMLRSPGRLRQNSNDTNAENISSEHSSVDVSGRNDVRENNVVSQLKQLYIWMSEAFSTLDLQNINCINLATDGPVIQKALATCGLEQLWRALVSEADSSQEVGPGKFGRVFFKWLGIEDDWAVMAGLQRSRSRAFMQGMCWSPPDNLVSFLMSSILQYL